jgi:hypothetical protein
MKDVRDESNKKIKCLWQECNLWWKYVLDVSMGMSNNAGDIQGNYKKM